MAEYLDKIFEVITDKSRKLSHRLSYVLITIFFLLVADYFFGISYYYTTQLKLNRIKEISEVLKDTSLSKSDIEYLKESRTYTLRQRTSTVDYLSRWTVKILYKHQPKRNKINITLGDELFFKLSTFGLSSIVFLTFLGIILFDKEPLRSNLLPIFVLFVLLFGIAFALYYFLSFIPLIEGNSWINFVGYAVIHAGLLGFITYRMYLSVRREEDMNKTRQRLQKLLDDLKAINDSGKDQSTET